jgi:hypothetical protein
MATNQTLNSFGVRQPARPIVSLSDIKAWLNIPESETKYDLTLNIINASVAQEFEQYIDSPILTITVDEIFDADNSDSIVPSQRPVRQIDYVFMDDSGQFDGLTTPADREASNMKLDPSSYFLRDDGTIVSNNSAAGIDLWNYVFGYGKGSIMVQYKAGYADTLGEVPSDLKHAALMRINQQYHLKQNNAINVKSKSANESSVTYELGMPKEVKDILDRYVDYSFHKANTRIKKYYEL